MGSISITIRQLVQGDSSIKFFLDFLALPPMVTSISMYRPSDGSIYGVSHAGKRKFKLKLPPRTNHILDVLNSDFFAIFNGVDYIQTIRLDDKDYTETITEIDGITTYKGIYFPDHKFEGSSYIIVYLSQWFLRNVIVKNNAYVHVYHGRQSDNICVRRMEYLILLLKY